MTIAPIAAPPVPSILTQLGFTPVGATRRRLFISSEGEPKTGKTSFLRTMPGPIAVINFDHGLEGSAELDVHGNPIFQRSIEMPDFDEGSKTMSSAEWVTAKTSYQQFKDLVDKIIRSSLQPGGVRTLGIDTGTAAYALAQMARFGRIAQVGEVPAGMWTSMQAEFENIFAPFETHACNVLITHRQGTKFKGLAGEREMKGYKGMQFASQVHLVHSRKITRVKDATTGAESTDVQFVIDIKECRQSSAAMGKRFEAIWLDAEHTQSIGARFVDIATAVLPNTQEGDWL